VRPSNNEAALSGRVVAKVIVRSNKSKSKVANKGYFKQEIMVHTRNPGSRALTDESGMRICQTTSLIILELAYASNNKIYH
jgi:dUTPase